jgi:hypothetical protein
MQDFWYVKELSINNGDLEFQLADMQNISQALDFEVVRVQPPSDSTLAVLETILNSKQYCQIKEATATNLTAGLRRELDSVLRSELEIRFLTDYVWKESPFAEAHHLVVNSLIKSFFMGEEGIRFYTEMEAHDYNGSVCGRIPNLPQSKPQFGGYQTVYSLKVVQSLLKYALENQFFNLTISRQRWQSSVFQFAVGDLAAAVSGLEAFNRSEIAQGQCEWNRTAFPQGLDVKMYNAS